MMKSKPPLLPITVAFIISLFPNHPSYFVFELRFFNMCFFWMLEIIALSLNKKIRDRCVNINKLFILKAMLKTKKKCVENLQINILMLGSKKKSWNSEHVYGVSTSFLYMTHIFIKS